jgi:hypothetical protein
MRGEAMISTRATVAGGTQAQRRPGLVARWRSQRIEFVLLPLAAFGVYWLSALRLDASNATIYFGSDAPLYSWLALGNSSDRIARFHPTTVVLLRGWMKLFTPLGPWISPPNLAKAMFAAVGAVGAWAAMWAFAAVAARRYVTLLGVIYAASLGVWYFSSIEESKIVSATLAGLYIAIYLHLRERWSLRGALLLTVVLLAACLNEIVAGFLVAIPVIDSLLRRGWDLRSLRWIAWHALAAPATLVFFETVVNGRLVAAGTDPEGASHLSMLFFYAADNNYSAWTIHYFLVNWLFFNIAAPTLVLSPVFPHWPDTKYFDPVLANYFSSPLSASLVILFGVMLLACLLPSYRSKSLRDHHSMLWALLVYALLRGAFFFIVFPDECILFSSSVTLAHLLLLLVPFTASTFPAKGVLLAATALLLLATTGTFILSQ